MGIQAPWVGKSKEEYYGEEKTKTFAFKFSLKGEVEIEAEDREEALAILSDMSFYDYIDWITEIKHER